MHLRALIFLAAVAAMAVPAGAGLVSYWDFNDGTGSSTAADVVGGRTGTLTNFNTATDWVTGHTGGAGDFALDFGGTGNNDHVRVNGFKGIAGRAARTMSAWVKTSNSGNHDIMSYGTNSGGQKWVFRVNNQNVSGGGKLRVEVNGGYQIGSTDLSNNTWRHVVATWENDGSPNVQDVKLYLDGSLQPIGNSRSNNVNTNTGQNLWIGGESFGTRWFAGQMDDVAFWNRTLTAGEIAQLAAGTAPTAIAQTVPQAALDYTAALDATPTNGSWEDLTNISGNHDWAINNNGGGARLVDVTDHRFAVEKAYTFNGGSDTATTSTLETFPGNPSNDSASFEILFKPSDTAGQEILFETGGTTGTSFTIDDTSLLFSSSTNNAASQGRLTYDGVTDSYLHAVGVIERTGSGADLSLYVNGVLVDSGTSGLTDWSGGNNAGLGQGNAHNNNGNIGGNFDGVLDGFGKFTGEIAFFRFYDTVLTPADAESLYLAAVVPEPTTFLIWSLGLMGLAMYGRRRRTR